MDQASGVSLPTCLGCRADSADLGPPRGAQPFSRHRHQGAPNPDTEVGAEFVGARPEGTRLGPCHEAEHLGHVVRAQFDHTGVGRGPRATGPVVVGRDHLPAFESEHGLPVRRRDRRAAEHVGERVRAEQRGQVVPVVRIRIGGQGGEGGHPGEIRGGPADPPAEMRVPTAERLAHRIVEH